jgi:CRISPR-associated protein Cas8a1/Csx13
MAKSKVKQSAPAELTMHLYGPGMTPLHRAGLGGLACTLRYIRRAYDGCALSEEELPAPFSAHGEPPWHIDQNSLTLQFGKPEDAAGYLRRLFQIAFQIKDGLIHLPGQYPGVVPPLSVRAELQLGLTLTFLQHGKTRKLGESRPLLVDPEDTGVGTVTIEYRPCSWFKHQDGWEEMVDIKSGSLSVKPVEVIGPLNPGAVVRHVAFAAATRVEETPERILPLYFALVGCLALPINRGSGVLLVPDVDDLLAFMADRPAMTPRSARECRVGGTGDAVLQALTRLRSRTVLQEGRLPACVGARFRPTSWASQQKSRVDTLVTAFSEVCRVEPADEPTSEPMLKQFEIALAELPPKVVVRPVRETTGRGRQKREVERQEAFRVESNVRPLVADNLARGQRWYHDFARLCRDRDTADRLQYERKGLQAMAENSQLTDDDETRFIGALHRAIFMARGKIYRDTMGAEAAQNKRAANPAVKNRWNNFMERVRLDLIGAKTSAQVQSKINELLARTGIVPDLRDEQSLRLVKNLLFGRDWQRVRNLALFALASYKRPRNLAPLPGDDDETSEPNS